MTIKAVLTRIKPGEKQSDEPLRSNEVEGYIDSLPAIGKRIRMVAKPFNTDDPDVTGRLVVTSQIQYISRLRDSIEFETESGSKYSLTSPPEAGSIKFT